MIGAQGFRTREAVANYKRRVRKLVPDDVRAARAANLHGEVVAKPAPVKADDVAAKEAAEKAAAEAAAKEAEEKAAADKAAAEKASKTKKK